MLKREYCMGWAMVTVGLLIFLAAPECCRIANGEPCLFDFYQHRSKYDSIVKAAKALSIANGTREEKTLMELPVVINKDTKGLYTITIITRALGHAGDYGYIYSDATLVPIPDSSYPEKKTLPGQDGSWFVDSKMNQHWWSIYNDLN